MKRSTLLAALILCLAACTATPGEKAPLFEVPQEKASQEQASQEQAPQEQVPQETAMPNAPTSTPSGPRAPAVLSDTWLNSSPLTAADLRDKVVLLDFWTFG